MSTTQHLNTNRDIQKQQGLSPNSYRSAHARHNAASHAHGSLPKQNQEAISDQRRRLQVSGQLPGTKQTPTINKPTTTRQSQQLTDPNRRDGLNNRGYDDLDRQQKLEGTEQQIEGEGRAKNRAERKEQQTQLDEQHVIINIQKVLAEGKELRQALELPTGDNSDAKRRMSELNEQTEKWLENERETKLVFAQMSMRGYHRPTDQMRDAAMNWEKLAA